MSPEPKHLLTTPNQRAFPTGIKRLHDPGNATFDVVFIHGLTGDRERTWTAAGAEGSWAQTLLPTHIPTARILTFGYDASVVKYQGTVSTAGVDEHGMNLLVELSGVYAEDARNDDYSHQKKKGNRSSIQRPIIFICHSLGGLICKSALVQSKSYREEHLHAIQRRTIGILFFGTPHRGSYLARSRLTKVSTRFLSIFKQTNLDLLRVLESDSKVLANIQLSFAKLIQAREEDGLDPFEITCFYEELPMTGVGLVVPRDSACLDEYIPIAIHKDHSDMVKFADAEEPGFKAVCNELIRWTEKRGLGRSKQRSHLGLFRISLDRHVVANSHGRST